MQLPGVRERAPDPLAGAGPHRQAVGIVNFRAPIVRPAPIVLAVEEHAGERRHTQALDRLARIQCAVDVHDHGAAGNELKAQRAGDTWRVHQGVHGQSARILRRPLEPKRGKARELLRTRKRRVHRQRARRQAVLPRIAAHRPKIARAEKRRHVILPVRHELHAKAGKAHVVAHQFRIDAGLVEFEHRRVIDDFVRLAVDDFVEAHGLGESAADMEELQAKLEAGIAPQCVVGAKAQRLKLIVAELRHRRRLNILRGLKGIAGELARLPLEPGIVEGLDGLRRGRRGCGHGCGRPRHRRGRGGELRIGQAGGGQRHG